MPTFSLSVQKITSQLYDAVGKNIYVSQRRIRLMQDFSQVWKQSIPAMRQNTMDVWMEGQSVWPGYSNKSYPAWKAKMGYSPDLNKRTGAMKGAMHFGQINEMTPMLWVWGIDRTDSEWYEGKSGPYPEEANKVRPFMVMTKLFMVTVQNNMRDYIKKIFGIK